MSSSQNLTCLKFYYSKLRIILHYHPFYRTPPPHFSSDCNPHSYLRLPSSSSSSSPDAPSSCLQDYYLEPIRPRVPRIGHLRILNKVVEGLRWDWIIIHVGGDTGLTLAKECSNKCESSFCKVPPLLRYGKYCGILYSGCPGEKPCDELDACCMKHDACISANNSEYLVK
ncbi:phospholipase A2-alpha [Tanacetum coccineum]